MTEFDSFTNQAFLTSSGDTSISVNLGIEVYQGALPQGVAEYLSVRDIGKNASLLDDGSRCPNGSWVSQPSLKGEVVQLRSNLLGEDRNFSTSDDLVSLADLIRFRRADGYADIIAFEETVDPVLDRKIGNIQRKMERSRRANNPHMYHADFEARKGEKTVTKKGKIKSKLEREKIVVVGNNPGRPVLKKDRFQNSKNYDRLAAEYKELNRIKSARTKNFHRSNINQLLDHGVTIVGEKLDGRGWSKLYGKSVNDTAQFFFYRELARKAKLAGGSFLDINTFQTALSQTHLDLSRQSKSLNERVHKDTSGRKMHRDLFSSFLGVFVEEKKVVKTNKKGKKYKATEHYLNPKIDLVEQFDILSPGMDKAWEVWEDKNKDLWNKVRPKARKQSRRMIRRNIRKRKYLNQLENLRLDIPEQGVDKD